MPPTPKIKKMQKLKKCQKWKSSKTHHFRRFQTKRTSPSFSAHVFTYYSTGQNVFSTFVRLWYFVDIRIIKNCIKLMFWRLGTMLERFFKAKSFGLHISKPKKIPGNIFFDISKFRKSSRRSLLGRQNCILSKKSVPQGPLGENIWWAANPRSHANFWKKVPEGFESRFDRLER